MHTVRDIRRANLLLLEEAMGSLQAVADLVGKSHSQVSQLKSANTHSTTGKPRGMGDTVAGHFAAALKVPAGWMDSPRTLAEVKAAVTAARKEEPAEDDGPRFSRAPSPPPLLAPQEQMVRLVVAFGAVPDVLPDGSTRTQLLDELLRHIQSRQQPARPLGAPSLLQSEDPGTHRESVRVR